MPGMSLSCAFLCALFKYMLYCTKVTQSIYRLCVHLRFVRMLLFKQDLGALNRTGNAVYSRVSLL